MNRRTGIVWTLTATFLALAPAASAQGNGHGHAYGHNNNGSKPSAAGAPELQSVSTTVVRSFGSWLDDASVAAPGAGSVSFSFAYWRTPGYDEFDVPVVDGGLGVTRRVQFGFSVPYYHAGDPGGPIARGLGDVYLSGKVQLRDPSSGNRLGFSVTPLVEILSYAPAPDQGRLQWALPASLELQRDRWRLFGSSGYFSRGAVFASGAFELALSQRAWASGTISRSHSLKGEDTDSVFTRSRTDVSGGMTFMLGQSISVFGNIGRTISRQDPNSATLVLTTGASFSFATR